MRVEGEAGLDQERATAVVALASAAATADGVTPLSEHVLLHVRDPEHGGATPGGVPPHYLAYDGPDLAGYAHLEPGPAGEPATAELVVHPEHRGRGAGRALLKVLAAGAGELQLWSHGHLDAARDFAAADGFTSVRELWQMRRPLGPGAPMLPEAALPEGFAARSFVVGQDEPAWLEVNARAFAHHPEQGRLTLSDLRLREAEPWFDPSGFILVEAADGALAAFHWTKVHEHRPAGGGTPTHPPVGEVYVVGVDPAYQGKGLGRAVTVLGLAHLQGRGLTEAMLYVDADNTAAVATYTRLGFRTTDVDVMYSRTTPAGVSR